MHMKYIIYREGPQMTDRVVVEQKYRLKVPLFGTFGENESVLKC